MNSTLNKILKTIQSCNTIEQVECAHNLIPLWNRLYGFNFEINSLLEKTVKQQKMKISMKFSLKN